MIDIFSITTLCPLINIPILQRSNSYVYFIIIIVIGYHVLFLALNRKGRKVACPYPGNYYIVYVRLIYKNHWKYEN